jgi:hypothetical protein
MVWMDILYCELVIFWRLAFRVDITEGWDLKLDLRARIARVLPEERVQIGESMLFRRV